MTCDAVAWAWAVVACSVALFFTTCALAATCAVVLWLRKEWFRR